MRHTCFWPIAAASLVLAVGAQGARPPQYGGELRVELQAGIQSLDPAASSPEQNARNFLASEVFETLVRYDAHGAIEPWLATKWTHDTLSKQWIFTARTGVFLHDDSVWQPSPESLTFPDDKPIGLILADLALLKNAVVIRGANGALTGTGPFKISRLDPGKSARFEVHQKYWQGRAYVDAVEVRMGRSLKDQENDADLQRADIIEVAASEIRRQRQRGADVRTSRPRELVALVLPDAAIPTNVREALALSMDRDLIQRLVLDRQGDATGALLPQWMSGYAFLFSPARDVARAKTLAGGNVALEFAVDQEKDPIGERIVALASDAGITLKTGGSKKDVRLAHITLPELDPATALTGLAAILATQSPEGMRPYETEQAMLKDRQVIPLFHLPAAFTLNPRVQGFPQNAFQPERWEALWIDETLGVSSGN